MNVTLTRLSNVLQKNSYHIQRSFKEVVGITPLHYLHMVRIYKAKKLLLNHFYSITDVGIEVGYSDSANFSTKFKEFENLTPREFRKLFLK